MNKSLLANKIQNLEGEINQLQNLKQNKEAKINQIQSLLLQASNSLKTLQEVNQSIPESILNPLVEQIEQLFSDSKIQTQITKTNQDSSLSPNQQNNKTEESNPDKLWQASDKIITLLQTWKPITHKQLQTAMTEAYGGNDAQGYWQWKTAYEALEIALVRHIRQHAQQPQSGWCLMHVEELENHYPTHTRRSEESVQLQQFSTPLPLAVIAADAAHINTKHQDIVLESSAGNGLLAIWAELQGASLILNEIAPQRNKTLAKLFPKARLFQENGENINDILNPQLQPTVALLNPPFTASPNVHKRNSEATFNHLYSAWQRLPQGGRLVAITANWFSPLNPKWHKAFAKMEQLGTVLFSVGIEGKVYRKQGTNIETRLTVIDKGVHNNDFQPFLTDEVYGIGDLLTLVTNHIPPRLLLDFNSASSAQSAKNDTVTQSSQPKEVEEKGERSRERGFQVSPQHPAPHSHAVSTENLSHSSQSSSTHKTASQQGNIINFPQPKPQPTQTDKKGEKQPQTNNKITKITQSPINIEYQPKATQNDQLSDALYQTYQPQTIEITGAKPHPTALVQSAAMASVKAPLPTYKPTLPQHLISQGILSSAQIESIIYAGEAHSQYLAGHYLIDDTREKAKMVREGSGQTADGRRFSANYQSVVDNNQTKQCDNQHQPQTTKEVDNTNPETSESQGVKMRRGWLLGDGTGAGKGRQAAGIILDNWHQGRKKALWVSKSDKLIEDARRDWQALGGNKEDILSLGKFNQGKEISNSQGILFCTYAMLRVKAKKNKISRIQQIINWLGTDSDNVIIFDECHAMGGAIATKGSRGMQKASQQGLAGLRLQYGLPNARIVYVSATGASKVSNLAYAVRLGLWQTHDIPFRSPTDFISSVERGGLAAMEVVSRDLKSLGLYLSRSLSYEGVEYDILEHELTNKQIEIYDAYAQAYQIIHQNIQEALEATRVISLSGEVRNSQAKANARSAFESSKQRFFNHLLTAMKMPTVIKAIQNDIDKGNAIIIQIVSTNEALLDRRLAEIPVSEWNDLNIDVTPREYILDYLNHAFPVQLHEVYTDEEGNPYTKPMTDDEGNPILSQEAVAKRDAMIESLALIPPIQGVLDQIIQHFGHQTVAEVTGRSKRIIRDTENGRDILRVNKRPASANRAEINSFMNDEKPILIFSDAGGTGLSFHAALNCKNQRQRIHYLLEAGWRADNAIQGLGRSHRSHQKQPPLFRPVTTNVKGEKRFLSTIAKRLDSLGALTKGQRETGSQGIFKEEDNFDSLYARTALNQLYHAIYRGQLAFCSLEQFQNSTGLQLASNQGGMKEDLPTMNQFLNRLLALPVSQQNQLFEAFEIRLEQNIEDAKNNGSYEVGVETLKAHSLSIIESQTIYQHPTGGETTCHLILRKEKAKILGLSEALKLVQDNNGRLLHNSRSGNVCLEISTNSILEDDGSVTPRVNLIRPHSKEKLRKPQVILTNWREIERENWCQLWEEEVRKTNPFIESKFYLITGLLLPIWNEIDTLNMRVWRMQSDDGQNLLGRMVTTDMIGGLYENLGINAPQYSPEDIYHAVNDNFKTMSVGRWQVRNSLVSGKRRLEITGFKAKSESDYLKTMGCFSEMIQWRLRIFIPNNDNAIPIIEKLMKA